MCPISLSVNIQIETVRITSIINQNEIQSTKNIENKKSLKKLKLTKWLTEILETTQTKSPYSAYWFKKLQSPGIGGFIKLLKYLTGMFTNSQKELACATNRNWVDQVDFKIKVKTVVNQIKMIDGKKRSSKMKRLLSKRDLIGWNRHMSTQYKKNIRDAIM